MPKTYDSRVSSYLENWMDVARSVKEVVLRLKPAADVYVFGSVVKGRFTGVSDIDILRT